MSYKSIEKAKWFFDNITIYLDSLLQIQLKVAARISSEVEDVLSEVIIKVKWGAVYKARNLFNIYRLFKCTYERKELFQNIFTCIITFTE